MDNIVMLFICLSIGLALRAAGRMPENAHVPINVFIVYVALPSLIFLQVHAVKLDPALLYAVLMPWLLFVISAILFWCIGRWLKLPRTTIGALAVMGGLGNTSFIGLPMIESFYGAEHMPTGIMVDQLGSYLVLSTIGIMLISFYGEAVVTHRQIMHRIVTFPPLIALVLALALIPVAYPAWLISVLARLGGTLAPLALVSIGMQLNLGAMDGHRRELALGLGYKLLMGPILMVVVYTGFFGLNGVTTRVTLFESAMAPMIGGSIVAIQYGLNARLITLMVGIGTALSFLTLPLWWKLLDLI